MPVRLGAISKSRRWMWRNAETPCPVPKPWPAFREGSVALESIRREDSSCLQPCRLSSSEPRLRNSQPTQQTTNQQPTWTTGPYNSPETPSREPCSEPWPGRAEPRRPGAPGQLRSLHLAIPRMPPARCERLPCTKNGPRRSWQRETGAAEGRRSASPSQKSGFEFNLGLLDLGLLVTEMSPCSFW